MRRFPSIDLAGSATLCALLALGPAAAAPQTTPAAPPGQAPAPAAAPPVYPMTEFSVQDLSGRTLDSRGLRGKIVLLDLWATWCGPCTAAAPVLDQMYRTYQPRGLEMIGIAVPPKASPDEVRQAARAMGMTYPVAVWNEELAQRIQGLRAVPTYILIARDWTVHKLWVGATPPGQIRKEIERLLAEPPAAARDAADPDQ